MDRPLERERRAEYLALVASAGCVAAIVLLALTNGLTFFLDEWSVILRPPSWSADSLLEPNNEHIYLGPVVVYKVLLGVFGMESTAPFRLVNILLLLLVVGLVFAYVRARLGDVLALIIACVLLFLGPSWENLLWPAGISFLGAMAAGVASLLALERETRRGDVAACGLLVTSTAFSSLGLVFAVGAAVDVVLRKDGRLQRALVPAVPVCLYLLWYASYGHEAEGAASVENLLAAPGYVWNAAASAMASLLGVTGIDSDSLGVDADLGRPLLVAALVLGLWLVARNPAVLSRQLWVVLASALAFWGLAALNFAPGREAGASRYQLIGGILLILIFAELLRGRTARRGWLWLAGIVGAAAILSNIGALRAGEDVLRERTDSNLAALAALEGARAAIDSEIILGPDTPGTPFPQPTPASTYFTALDRWGSPVSDPQAATHGTEAARETADRLLAAVLELRLVPLSTETGAADSGCVEVEADAASGLATVELPPGGAEIVGESGLENVRLRRWSETGHPVDLGAPPIGAVALDVPTDDFADPWITEVGAPGQIRVCPLDPGSRPRG